MDRSEREIPQRPMLFCLNGNLKGRTLCPATNPAVLGSEAGCAVRFESSGEQPVAPRHAAIHEKSGVFTIESLTGDPLLVNEVPVTRAELSQNDLIRLGPQGPVLRFRASGGPRPSKTLKEIVADSTDYATHNHPRRRRARRYSTFAMQMVKDAVANSTRQFRMGFAVLGLMIVALGVALAWTTAAAGRDKDRLARGLTDEGERLRQAEASNEQLRQALVAERSERERMKIALDQLHEGLKDKAKVDETLMDALRVRAERAEKELAGLSRDMGTVVKDVAAAREIHRRFAGGVGIIAIGVSLYSERLRAFVRLAVDPATGKPKEDEDSFEVTLGGTGEKYLEWTSGSGFVVSKDGLLLSNRHVMDPWYKDPAFGRGLLAAGIRPVREVFMVFFPGLPEPIELTRVAIAADADLALARLQRMDERLPVLDLAPESSPPVVGQKTILLGYPLGLEGLITKLDSAATKALMSAGVTSLEVALRTIASLGGIRGTMTQGVLSNVTSEALVYDAETISGGSGGPLFSSDGWVIGVNQAITRFRGANLGVPIEAVRAMLAQGPLTERTFDDLEMRPEDVKPEESATPPPVK